MKKIKSDHRDVHSSRPMICGGGSGKDFVPVELKIKIDDLMQKQNDRKV
jgi:hypothetical protein